ncbi:MAG: acetylxylan esterase [Bacteroidota bacterium]
MKKSFFIVLLASLPIFAFSQAESLKVLNNWKKYSDVENALYHHYLWQANKLLDERESEISKLSTKADWEKRQERIRKTLAEAIGTFPDKTPLNARIMGVSEKEEYRVEKVIFESRPEFYVTAALYIPKELKGKAPAIIHTIGHSQAAFRRDLYQRSAINFVEKGFVVLTFDPLGQGERVQYFSPEPDKSVIGGTVTEHVYAGVQTIMLGKTLANYFVWDGIRAVDYLLTREEVDSERIGITGLSGGGTQSAMIAAMDERIIATAPSCYLTSMRRLMESIGPQDAEQNLYHGIANGIDHADFLEVRIPKPALMVNTTRDFFSIQGAMETAQEVKNAYGAFGADENFGRVEDDTAHAMTSMNREARHAFFQKHLNLPGELMDVEVAYLDKELQITKTGQISTSIDDAKTVFDLNRAEAEIAIDKLNKSRKNLDAHKIRVKESSEELSGYINPEKIENSVFTGRYQRDGYAIEMRFIQGEGDYPIPFLLFLPDKQNGSPILYLHGEGKEANGSTGGEIEWFVKRGHPVLAPDLIGIGEMALEERSWIQFGEAYGVFDYSNFFASVQLGRSLVGIHAGDIQRVITFLKQDKRIKAETILAIAQGETQCASLLHAAAFESEFSKIALIDPLISYRSVVMNRFYKSTILLPFVPGALTAYDLPDLAAIVAPNRLMIVNVRDQMGSIASKKMINTDFKVVESAFSASNSKENLEIKRWDDQQSVEEIFSAWLK